MGTRIIASRVSNCISGLRYVKLVDNPARGPSLGASPYCVCASWC